MEKNTNLSTAPADESASTTLDTIPEDADIETLIYTIGIPNAGRSLSTLVHINRAVLEWYRYAEIERMVTGTHHVTVCAPEYYEDSIDEEVYVTIDENGELIIYAMN